MATLGRPTKLTMERATAIIHAIRRGNYMSTAAALAGVGERTVYDWLKRGEKLLNETLEDQSVPESELIYGSFALGVHRAAAEVEDESVHALRTGKMLVETVSGARSQITDRKGHLKFLERRYPDRWGSRKAIEHSGGLELNHQAKVVVLPGIHGPINDSVATEPGATDAIPPEQCK